MSKIKPGAVERLQCMARLRRRPVSLAARLRMYWRDFVIHVLFEDTETCQDCGRDYVLWRAPDDLYQEVYGSLRGCLCPACFSRHARARGVIVGFAACVLRRDEQVYEWPSAAERSAA